MTGSRPIAEPLGFLKRKKPPRTSKSAKCPCKSSTAFSRWQDIGIVKMDVQGHELSVLQGMSGLLESRAVRDIVFEEEKPFPAPTHQFLKTFGYSIFGLQGSLTAVQALPDTQPAFDAEWGPVPNYLATHDPARAVARFKPLFWRSFGFSKLWETRNSQRESQPPSTARTWPWT